ncbi:V-type ATP synthase subunit I [Bienertia sinuspersici]
MASHTSIDSGSSSRTRSRSFPLPHQVVCYHNEVALPRMNAELEAEKDELKEKIRRLKAKKEKLVDEVEEMGVPTIETMLELKENKKGKRLMLTLIFSWAFFTLILFMK